MHAPIAGTYVNGTWKDGLSLASADEARRKAAVDETLATLDVAAAVPYHVLVRALRRAGSACGGRRQPSRRRWCAASRSCRRSRSATACGWPSR